MADLPYTGIGIGYGWGANDPGGNPEYVNRGLYDFQPVFDTPTTLSDVRIVGNHVRNVVQTLFDASCHLHCSAMPRSAHRRELLREQRPARALLRRGLPLPEPPTGNVFVRTAGQWAHANNQNGNRTGDLTLIDNYATQRRHHRHLQRQPGNVGAGNRHRHRGHPAAGGQPDDLPGRSPGRPPRRARPAASRRGRGPHRRPASSPSRPASRRPSRSPSRTSASGRASELALEVTVPDRLAGRAGRQAGALRPRLRRVRHRDVEGHRARVGPGPGQPRRGQGDLTGRADQADLTVNRTLSLTALNPLTSMKSHGSVPTPVR